MTFLLSGTYEKMISLAVQFLTFASISTIFSAHQYSSLGQRYLQGDRTVRIKQGGAAFDATHDITFSVGNRAK
jgi:hypothetical protein